MAENYVRRHVPRCVFSAVRPTPLDRPRKVVAVSKDALRDVLDLDPAAVVDGSGAPDFADFLSGNKVLEGTSPLAHRYGGHQFGYWVRERRNQGPKYSFFFTEQRFPI